jgi:hypothetical protein
MMTTKQVDDFKELLAESFRLRVVAAEAYTLAAKLAVESTGGDGRCVSVARAAAVECRSQHREILARLVDCDENVIRETFRQSVE